MPKYKTQKQGQKAQGLTCKWKKKKKKSLIQILESVSRNRNRFSCFYSGVLWANHSLVSLVLSPLIRKITNDGYCLINRFIKQLNFNQHAFRNAHLKRVYLCEATFLSHWRSGCRQGKVWVKQQLPPLVAVRGG